MRKVQIALFLAFIPCVIPRLVHLVPRIHMYDFEVYYSAAVLAQQHQGAAIYGGADDGSDPQLKWAEPDAPIAVTGHQAGISEIRLYVYPPILADLLIPLSLAPLPVAKVIWTTLNVTAMLLIVLMLTRILHVSAVGMWALVLLLGMLFSSPMYSCVFWGQITLLLTFCWIFGMYAYSKGWLTASAFVFALAAAIKLTPLVVIVPFLFWKDWKWLRAFAILLLLLILVMAAINSPYALQDYFSHVMPSMSRGIPIFSNHTIAAATQYLYVALNAASIFPIALTIPNTIISAGKIVSLVALLLAAVVPLYRCRNVVTLYDRLVALAMVAMVSPAVAPVSWIHAYAICYPALALLWGEAFMRGISASKLVLLTVCSIILNSIVMTDVIEYLVHSDSHRVLASIMMFVTPLAALILAYLRLKEMNHTTGELSVAAAG